MFQKASPQTRIDINGGWWRDVSYKTCVLICPHVHPVTGPWFSRLQMFRQQHAVGGALFRSSLTCFAFARGTTSPSSRTRDDANTANTTSPVISVSAIQEWVSCHVVDGIMLRLVMTVVASTEHTNVVSQVQQVLQVQ